MIKGSKIKKNFSESSNGYTKVLFIKKTMLTI